MSLLRLTFGAALITAAGVLAILPVDASLTGAGAPAVVREVNRERVRSGLAPLALDARLCAIAQEHASDMSRRRYFSHVTPEGVDPFGRMRRARYRFRAAGENLGLAENISEAQTLIWNDPPHRKVLLMRTFHKVGVGTSRTADGTILVEDFSD
jgi:uncharacterized protein YkwD